MCSTRTETGFSWGSGGRCARHGISKLGCEYQYYAGSHSQLCVSGEGQGREMFPDSSFVPGEVPQGNSEIHN